MYPRVVRSHLTALLVAAFAAILSISAMILIWTNPDVLSSLTASRTTEPVKTEAPRATGSQPAPAPPPADLQLDTFLPNQKMDLTPDQAEKINLASPLATANPSAPLFNPSWLSPTDLATATDCMAKAIYYEASQEPPVGQMAVAQVILNRLRHPRYPKSICEVVFQGSERPSGCQFTFTCDGAMKRRPDAAGLARAHSVADAALHGAVSFIAGQATHYHTIWIVPIWANQMNKVAIIGHHVFYRQPAAYGGWPEQVTAGAALSQQPVEPALPISQGIKTPATVVPNLIAEQNSDKTQMGPVIVANMVTKKSPQAEEPLVNTTQPPATRATDIAPPSPLFGIERRRRPNIALPPGSF